MILAAKNSLSFGVFSVDTSTTGQKSIVPVEARPNIGPLAFLAYKTGELRYSVTGVGALVGTISVKAGTTVLGTADINGNGGGRFTVDLAVLQGQERLELQIDVTTAGAATAQVWAALDVEQPVVMK